MTSEVPIGFWTTDAPLTPEQIEEDLGALRAISVPQTVTLQSAECYVNGRLWQWERMAASFKDIRRGAA